MAFDEEGQADNLRRIQICERSYRILVDQVDFALQILFLTPIFSCCQMENIKEMRWIFFSSWIRENLCKCQWRVSNVSFSFRGNNTVKEAMHSHFYIMPLSMDDHGIVNLFGSL